MEKPRTNQEKPRTPSKKQLNTAEQEVPEGLREIDRIISDATVGDLGAAGDSEKWKAYLQEMDNKLEDLVQVFVLSRVDTQVLTNGEESELDTRLLEGMKSAQYMRAQAGDLMTELSVTPH